MIVTAPCLDTILTEILVREKQIRARIEPIDLITRLIPNHTHLRKRSHGTSSVLRVHPRGICNRDYMGMLLPEVVSVHVPMLDIKLLLMRSPNFTTSAITPLLCDLLTLWETYQELSRVSHTQTSQPEDLSARLDLLVRISQTMLSVINVPQSPLQLTTDETLAYSIWRMDYLNSLNDKEMFIAITPDIMFYVLPSGLNTLIEKFYQYGLYDGIHVHYRILHNCFFFTASKYLINATPSSQLMPHTRILPEIQ